MDMFTEEQVSAMETSRLRYEEARYLYSQFVNHCGPPQDSYFHMIAYFDAFLFCFVSIEEIISEEDKKKLNENPIFKFLKAARNITAHHSVLAAVRQKDPFIRPFSRVIDESIGGTHSIASARLAVKIEKFREIFSLVVSKRPREKCTIDAAEIYLRSLEENDVTEVYIEEIAKEKLEDLNTDNIAAAAQIVRGTARSMGIDTE